MTLAERLWLDHSVICNDGQRAVPDGDFQEAINEALERAAQECDAKAESIVTCLNRASAASALRYTAQRIRNLKGQL